MKPTKKSNEIESLLTMIAGVSRAEAMENSTCTMCKEPVETFNDELSKKEYLNSGMCQSCQDSIFE